MRDAFRWPIKFIKNESVMENDFLFFICRDDIAGYLSVTPMVLNLYTYAFI